MKVHGWVTLALLAGCPDETKESGETGTTPVTETDTETDADTDADADADTDVDADTDTDTADPGPYDMRVTGGGYGAYDGYMIYSVLVDNATSKVIASGSQLMDADGVVRIEYKDLLVRGGSYRPVFFLDVNGDTYCQGPSAKEDFAYADRFDDVQGDLVYTHHLDMLYAYEGCFFWAPPAR